MLSDRQKQIQALAAKLMANFKMSEMEARKHAVALIDYQRGPKRG